MDTKMVFRDFPMQDSALVTAGLGTIAMSFVDGSNLMLWIALGIAYLLDQMVGMCTAYIINPVDWWDGNIFIRGMLKKLILMVVVICAGLLDSLATLVPQIGNAAAEVTPAFKTVAFLAILGQIGSIAKNAARAGVQTPALDYLLRRIQAEETEPEPLNPPRRRRQDRSVEYPDA